MKRLMVLGTVIVVLLAACGSSSKSNGATGTTSGSNSNSTTSSSAKPITVGLVTSLTGPAAFNFNGAKQAVEARIDLQNAQGGVNGHQIKLAVADDQSSTLQAQTAVESLTQTNHAFGLIFISDLVSAAYRVAQQQGIPVVGAPIDGPEWGLQPNTNMVSVQGNQGKTAPSYTYVSQVAKLAGATNMAGLAIANEEPSIIGVQHFATGASAIGLPVGYKNYSIPIGTVNVGPVVLGMQQAHVNGFFSLMLNTTDFAIMTAAKQEGLNLAAPIDYTSYSQDLLDNSSARQGAQGIISYVQQVPVEEHTPATVQEQAAFQKYENFSGVPNLNWTYGWLSADLFIKGLEGAGSNPTRTSFLNALHNTTDWTGGGLEAQAPDLSLAGFGHAATHSCGYFVQLKGSAFVPLNGGKPVCGTAVAGT